MNLKIQPLTNAIIGSFALTAATAHAVTVLTDNFTDGNRTASPAWYLSGAAPTSASVTSGANSIAGSNSLFFDSSNTFQGLTANFTAAGTGGSGALAVGESYILTLDLRMVSASNVANGMRIGLGNSAGNPFTADGTPAAGSVAAQSHFGYYAGFGTGTTTSLIVNQDTGGGNNPGFTSGSDTSSLGSVATGVALTNGNNRSILFEVERTSTTDALITASYFSTTGSTGTPAATFSFTDTTGAYFNFNQVTIMSGGVTQDFTFDNVVLTHVPEPSAALLGSLGVLALLRRRRA